MLPKFVFCLLFRVWLAVVLFRFFFFRASSVKLKMVYSDYAKERILFYRCSGKSLQQIVQSLAEEGHVATKASMAHVPQTL